MNYRLSFRSRYGQVSFAIIVVAALLFLFLIWRADGFVEVLRVLPFPLTIGFFAFWYWAWPVLQMDDAGLVLRNQLRTVRAPWHAVDRAEARFGLYLYLGPQRERYYAAGVPARSGLGQMTGTKTPVVPTLHFKHGPDQSLSVDPAIGARLVEEELYFRRKPSERPELSGAAIANLANHPRYVASVLPQFIVAWNWHMMAIQGLLVAWSVLAIVIR